MEEYQDFLVKVKKAKGGNKHKISNSYGVYDAYKYYRKNKPPESKYVLTESQYFSIIKSVNAALLKTMLEEADDIKLPCLMGKIELRVRTVEPKLDSNGKLIYKAPVNWGETLKLWYENPQARENKILVKQESRETYRIFYCKRKAIYKNKSYVVFKPSRSFKKEISKSIKEGKIKGAKSFIKLNNNLKNVQ